MTSFAQLSSIVLLLAVYGVTASIPVSNINHEKGFVSLKLNSRHTELERRRRERRNLAETETVTDANANLDIDQSESELEYNEERYRRREEAVQVGALFEGYGTHYIDLWCGSPPQRQTVIVDTGSGVTAFPCSGCRDCGVPNYHIDRLFVEKESDTFQTSTCTAKSDCIMSRSNCMEGTCKIGMSYAEGSRWNAYEAVDSCYVGGPHEIPLISDATDANVGVDLDVDVMDPEHAADLAFDMTFGCQTLVTGLFKTQLADGIMGMSNQASTFWSQMFQANKMGSDQQFSLCFSRPPRITREGTEAGAMTLGGTDERLHTSPMVYTPRFNQGRSSFFSVKVRKFMLRDGKYGESVQSTDKNPNKGVVTLNVDEATMNKGGIIVDSGTTDTYWVNGIRDEFGKAFQELAGRPHHNSAMSLTDDELQAMPTILLQLYSDDDANSHVDDKFHTPGLAGAMDSQHPSDVILAIPPSHYMEYNPDKDTYTSRFYPSERSGSVLGANAMMGHDVFFDIDKQRIGWAESDCDYTKTVQDNGYSFDITGDLQARPRHVGDRSDHNKHSTNNKANDDSSLCETITSGNKCQKTEGCTWGWGKCTAKTDVEASTDSPTWYPTNVPDPPMDEANDATPQIIDVDELIKQANEHQTEIIAAAAVVSVLLACCCYSLCCRSSRSNAAKDKYSTVEPAIELTNGSGFQDEPDDEDESEGSRTSSQFRDHPDDGPEFDGDFA